MNQIPVVATASRPVSRPVSRPASRPAASRPVVHPYVAESRFEEAFDLMNSRVGRMEAIFFPARQPTVNANDGPRYGDYRALRDAVKVAIEKAKTLGVEFVFDQSMRHTTRNQFAFDCIYKGAIEEVKALTDHPDDQELSACLLLVLKMKIRNQFDAMVKKHKKKDLTPHEVEMRNASLRKAGRLQRKRAVRNEQYLVSQGLPGLGFGTSEECEAVLQSKYMSEEEEGDDPVAGGYFRTVVPSWRSEELNNFYRALDRAAMQGRPRHARVSRRVEVVEMELPDKYRQVLPRWAYRS